MSVYRKGREGRKGKLGI